MHHNIIAKFRECGISRAVGNVDFLVEKRWRHIFEGGEMEYFFREAVNLFEDRLPTRLADHIAHLESISPGVTSLLRTSEICLMEQLGEVVDDLTATIALSTGGQIKIKSLSSITLRWDSTASVDGIIRYGRGVNYGEDASDSLQQLLADCQPVKCDAEIANTLHEHGAGELDKMHFCTDLNLHECGIIDAVGQVLLPILADTSKLRPSSGISAELQKLQVRSNDLSQ